jgi:hypothetical protein
VRALGGRRLLLTTNAHPISLAIKAEVTGLAAHFDELVSSHEFGVPKESAGFWPRLEAAHAVDPRRTLLSTQSAVLPPHCSRVARSGIAGGSTATACRSLDGEQVVLELA